MAWAMSRESGHGRRLPLPLRNRAARITAWFSLLLLTFIWGSTFPLMARAARAAPLTAVLALRFDLAAFLLAPVLLRSGAGRRVVIQGMGAGALMGLGILGQARALPAAGPDPVAFVTGLSVVLVPLAEAGLGRRPPSLRVLAAVTAGTAGLGLLAGPGGGRWTPALGWTAAGTVALAVQIVATARLGRRLAPWPLAAAQVTGAAVPVTTAALAGALRGGPGLFHWFSGGGPEAVAVLYLAGPATLGAVWLQMRAQAGLRAVEAALGFNLEPVWAAVLTWAWLGTVPDALQAAGAFLILGSMFFLAAGLPEGGGP